MKNARTYGWKGWCPLLLGFLTACGAPPAGEQLRDAPTTPQWDARLRAMDDALADNPDRADYYFLRAELLSQTEQPDRALADLEAAVALDSTEPRYQLALARGYQTAGNLPAARHAARRAEALGQSDAPLLFTLGALRLDQHDYPAAADYLDRGLAREPLSAEGRYLRGRLYAATNDTTRALEQLGLALAQDSAHVAAYRTLALIYQAQGRYADALPALAGARRLAPTDAGLPYAQAMVYEALNRPDTARALYQQAVARDSTLLPAWYRLGTLHLNGRNYAAAAGAFGRVVWLAPDQPEGHYWLAFAARRQGDRPTAERHLERVVALGGPQADEAARTLAYLRRPPPPPPPRPPRAAPPARCRQASAPYRVCDRLPTIAMTGRLARSNRPSLRPAAPVKAPFS